jgi:hypothetical protein
MPTLPSRLLGLAVLSILLAACDESPPVEMDASVDAGPPDGGPPDAGPLGPIYPIFDPAILDGVEGTGAFFDFPFPSDLRTDAEGRPNLQGFARTRGLVADVIGVLASEGSGFSPITGVYFRFTGPLAGLPAEPEAAVADASRVWLVDIDAESRERGRRMPAYVTFRRTATRFWAANTLAVRALPGVHLHPGRRYAAVVRTGLLAADGEPVQPSTEFAAVTEGDGPLAAHYRALFADLEAVGIDAADVLVATAFTVGDRAREMDLAREYIHSVPLPEVRNWTRAAVFPAETRFTAEVDVYELLEGEPPFTTFGSGRIAFDAEGQPTHMVRRTVRIGLSVPTTPAPEGGYPVVLYGHGTGGDHRTHFGDEGTQLAGVGAATLGFEAALHGDRVPGGLDVETLILSNPVATREVVRQTVIDQMLFYRLLASGAFDVPAEVAGADAPIALARQPVLYMGHSQGSQEAGVLLGVEPTVQAAFLSAGGGGGILSIVHRLFNGSPIVCTVAPLVGEDCADMDEDHPLLTLVVQPLLDPADPLSFAHRFVRERSAEWAPLSIAMTEGTRDVHTPPQTIEALAAAIGLPQLEPVAQTLDPLRVAAVGRQTPPVTGNLALPSGAMVTGGLMQWPGADHFVIYRDDDALRRYVEFFRTMLADGTPTIVGPAP